MSLAAQEMEGLCLWALALQEFNFNIKYSISTCADALSRQVGGKLCATTGILAGQITDEITGKITGYTNLGNMKIAH